VETDASGKVRATSAHQGGGTTTGQQRIQFGWRHHGGVQQGGRLGVGSDAWQDLMCPPAAPCRCRRGGGGLDRPVIDEAAMMVDGDAWSSSSGHRLWRGRGQ
jgi:hypothetical protein